MHQIIRQHCRVGKLGLAHHLHRARVIQKQVVHQTTPPRADTMRATVAHVADERVTAAIKVEARVIRAQAILARPVDFKVSEKDAVKGREDGELVRVFVHLAQVLAVLGECARLVPALRHTGVVLPRVEEVEVLGVGIVQRDHAELLAEMGNVSAVNGASGARLGRPARVPHQRCAWVVGQDVGERGSSLRGIGCSGAIGGHPDGPCAKGATGTLPERRAQQDELVGCAEVVAVAERVVDGEHGGAQLVGERGAVGAGEGEAEEFLFGADGEEDVDDEPCLSERGRCVTVPDEGRGRGAAGASPWCVVGLGGPLAGLEILGLAEVELVAVQSLGESLRLGVARGGCLQLEQLGGG